MDKHAVPTGLHHPPSVSLNDVRTQEHIQHEYTSTDGVHGLVSSEMCVSLRLLRKDQSRQLILRLGRRTVARRNAFVSVAALFAIGHPPVVSFYPMSFRLTRTAMN
jgi:hypothetical protein